MNNRFIESCHIALSYEKKPNTKTSFALVSGKNDILPKTICLGIFAQKKTSSRDSQKKNEINGRYTKSESGIYFDLNDRYVHTSVWNANDFPEFYGYGVIDERYNVYDLVIINSDDNCTSTMDIHIFRGLGLPQHFAQVMDYLRRHINKKPQ